MTYNPRPRTSRENRSARTEQRPINPDAPTSTQPPDIQVKFVNPIRELISMHLQAHGTPDPEVKRLLGLAKSQCTYRCVVLPDSAKERAELELSVSLSTYRCVVLPDLLVGIIAAIIVASQCTYRCVVLPDRPHVGRLPGGAAVSMHLQVRGAP